MEAIFETFAIGGIIGGGAYLLLSWLDSTKNTEKPQAQKKINKVESKDRHSWKVTWVDPKTGAAKSNEEYRSGYVPHNSWYVVNSLSPKNVEAYMKSTSINFDYVYANPTRFIQLYKEHISKLNPKGNFTNKAGKFITKDTNRKPKTKIELSMLDFFRHRNYREFEADQGIDIKNSELEIIEIFKLYKAWLLLNYNIEVSDPNE